MGANRISPALRDAAPDYDPFRLQLDDGISDCDPEVISGCFIDIFRDFITLQRCVEDHFWCHLI